MGRPAASSSKAKLGKRKPERDDDGGRVAKKPKGALIAGKAKPRAKGKSNGKKVALEDEAAEGNGSVGWEDVEDVDVRTEARCVCPLSVLVLVVTHDRSLFHDSDGTEEDEPCEEFTGFSGDLDDLESDEDEAEE